MSGLTVKSDVDDAVKPVEFPARSASGISAHEEVDVKYSTWIVDVPRGDDDETLNEPHTVPVAAIVKSIEELHTIPVVEPTVSMTAFDVEEFAPSKLSV